MGARNFPRLISRPTKRAATSSHFLACLFSQAGFSERFEREVRAVAALNHPNICQLHDVGPNYLAMELTDGSQVGPVYILSHQFYRRSAPVSSNGC
jgi:serine/threonine protein kinase